jgi:hypothetical protein
MSEKKKQEMEMVNGRSCAKGWGRKLLEEQRWTHMVIGKKKYKRIPFGEESGWGDSETCHDCVAAHGQIHVEGCDVERCPKCGGQLISCDCGFTEKSGMMVTI